MQSSSLSLLLTLFLSGFCLGLEAPPPAPIEGILLRPDVWESKKEDLDADLTNLRFEWNSVNQDVARSVMPGLAFQKHLLDEAILSFREGKLVEARLLYFNRGDSGALREDQFQELIEGITADLSAVTGCQPANGGRDAHNAVKAEGRIWETTRSRYLLEWSATKGSHLRRIPFRPEFIRLTIRPAASASVPVGAAPVTSRDL